MRIVKPGEWDGTAEALANRIDAFRAAREAHARTVGQPAPIEAPIVEELAKTEEQFQLAASLPAPAEDAAAVDRVLTDRWLLDRMAIEAARERGAPEYVTRHAQRVGG